MEALPKTPEWKTAEIVVDGYPTSKPIIFLYRDGLECVQFQFGNPTFGASMSYTPQRVFTDKEKTKREYSEFFTGDNAWSYQVSHFCATERA